MSPYLVTCLLMPAITVLAQSRAPQGSPTADQVLAQARHTYSEQGGREALPGFERALALYREARDRHGEAVVLGHIGNCYESMADYPRAIDYLRQSLDVKQELGDRLEAGKTLSNLGLVYWHSGDYAKATDHLTRALEIAHQVRDRQLEASAHNNLGLVYDERGDYQRSLPNYRQALDLFRAVNHPLGEGQALGNIGGVYLLLGEYREGTKYYQQALAIGEAHKFKRAASQDLGDLALCQLGLGQPEEAVRTFDRALALAHEAGFKEEEADWHKGKGSALMRLGKYDPAREEYQRALLVYEQAGLKRELIETTGDTLVVGASGTGGRKGKPGVVYVYRFNGSGFDLESTVDDPLNNSGDGFGSSVAVGDVDGDGAADLIVGADGASVGGASGAGIIYVFPSPLTSAFNYTLTTGISGDNLGYRLSSGILSSSTATDVIATTSDSAKNPRALIFSGPITGNRTASSFDFLPYPGLTAAWAQHIDTGDMTGDGRAEVLVGAPDAASSPSCTGDVGAAHPLPFESFQSLAAYLDRFSASHRRW